MRSDELLPEHLNASEFNGVTVRKGTVGAFLISVRTWRDPNTSPETRQRAERDMIDALPALRALGLFDVFDVRDHALRALIDSNL